MLVCHCVHVKTQVQQKFVGKWTLLRASHSLKKSVRDSQTTAGHLELSNEP